MIILQVVPFSGDLQSTAARNPRSQRPRKKSSDGIFECVKCLQWDVFFMSSRHLEHTPCTPVRWRWSGVSFRCLLIIPRAHGKYLVFSTENPMENEHTEKCMDDLVSSNKGFIILYSSSLYVSIDYLGTPQHWKVIWTLPILKGKDHGFQANQFLKAFAVSLFVGVSSRITLLGTNS